MAKKKITKKSELKKIVLEFLEGSLAVFSEALSKANPLDWIRSMVNFKKNVRRYLLSFVLVIAGIMIFGLGIAAYLNSLFPSLKEGCSEMIVGLALILFSLLICKIKRR